MIDDHDAVVYSGNWVNGVTEDFDAALQISFFGEEITLTLGTDVDRSICDVLVDNVFWGSLDTYAATSGQLEVTIPLARLGQHTLEIRNRPERNKAAVPTSPTSFKLEFVQMETLYDGQTLQYSYDDLSRLLAADYFAAWDAVNPVREYDFSYDVAGNRLSEVVNVDGSPFSSQTHTYDAANRISNAGFVYNDAGQMTADGTLSYSWDRAGRLLGAGDSSYAYNGLGQRVQQTVSGVVTDYLLDVQPGLAKVIAAMTGANTERFVHERGLLSQQDSSGTWHWVVNDGLGSVRVQADSDFDVEGSRLFAPYGAPFGEQGAFDVPFAFTGEMLDANGLQYHRARYYNSGLGVFPSLDPVEGVLQQAMSLNRYAYVAGNVVNLVDPSGKIYESLGELDCSYQDSCEEDCMNATFPPAFPGSDLQGFPSQAETATYIDCLERCRGIRPPVRRPWCPPSGATDCQRFISEVGCFIESYWEVIHSNWRYEILSWFIDDTSYIVRMLAWYYSGFEPQFFSVDTGVPDLSPTFYLPLASIAYREDVERYPVPRSLSDLGIDELDNDMPFATPEQIANTFSSGYGFRRPYFHNTHHYMGYLWAFYTFPMFGGLIKDANRSLEESSLQGPHAAWQNSIGSRNEDLRRLEYAHEYRESVNDLYIVEHAERAASYIASFGIEALPEFLEREFCATSDSDVFSLQPSVNQYFFDLPMELWPDESAWPDNG